MTSQPTLTPAMMASMFFKLKLQVGVHKGSFLPPDKAADFLQRAAQLGPQLGFEWVFVDKPTDGSLFIFRTRTGEVSIPDDGYGWMDDEISQRVVVDAAGREVEVIARNLGFTIGDTHVTMTRRRYRLTSNPDFQLLHYTAVHPDAVKIPLQVARITNMPRDPLYFQKIMKQASSTPGTSSVGSPPAHGGSKKKIKSKMGPAQVRVVEDENDPEGDELDGSVNRAVALERYKRNHIFIDEIFSPFTADIVRARERESPLYAGQSVKDLTEKKKALEEELVALANANAQEKVALQAQNKAFHRVMDDLHGISDLESWAAIKANICLQSQDFYPARCRPVV